MPTRRTLAAALALAAAAALGTAAWLRLTTGPVGNSAVPEPAKRVDLRRYLGRWHEIGRYENRFERGMDGVTAEYALLPDGRISVANAGFLDPDFRRRKVARGKAKVVPGSGDSKLKVSFFGPFYLGDYWVLDRADDYSWSIVGEPSGRYLWLLAREPHPDERLVRDLFARAAALGYDTSLIRRTLHPARA